MKTSAHAKRRAPIASAPRAIEAFGDNESRTVITDWLDRWLQGAGHAPRAAAFLVPVDKKRKDPDRTRALAAAPPMPRGVAFLVYSPDTAPRTVPLEMAEQHMWSFFALLPKNPHTSQIALHAAAYLRRLPTLNPSEVPPHQAACDFITALRLAADYLGAVTDPGQDAFWVDALRRALALSLTNQGLALGEGFEMVDAEFLYVLEANMLSDLGWHLSLGADSAASEKAFFSEIETAPVVHAGKALSALDEARASEGVGLRALLTEVTPAA